VADQVQAALEGMEQRDFVLYLRDLRRRERHSRRLARISVDQWHENHPGHPLGRGFPPGRPMRIEGENHREAAERLVRQDPCCYCGRKAGTVDHIVPKCSRLKGVLYDWSNFAGSCDSCNQSKGSLSLLEFLSKRHDVAWPRVPY
jgi:5-methylcytosine-specific restriction endonuclease McrA